MADYEVTFARSARRELEGLVPPLANRILTRIQALAREPRPPGARKVQGRQNLWRIRVGDYRVIYSVYDDQRVVDVVKVRHRREAYR
jgi:mRNA interferase RelE/StbE